MFTPPGKEFLIGQCFAFYYDFSLLLTSGSAGLVRNESSEIEVFAAKDLDFAIDDEGKVAILLGSTAYKIG